jgi:hypothetical protein
MRERKEGKGKERGEEGGRGRNGLWKGDGGKEGEV